jgi:hypothetical protein
MWENTGGLPIAVGVSCVRLPWETDAKHVRKSAILSMMVWHKTQERALIDSTTNLTGKMFA